MPRSKPPRRPHVRRELRVPVTDGLVREVARALDVGLLTLRERVMQPEHFDEMADALNLIGVALSERKIEPDAFRQVQSAASAMNVVLERWQRTGTLAGTVYEIEPIRMGINAAIAVMPRLTVNDLQRANRFLIEQSRAAATARPTTSPTPAHADTEG